MSLSFDNLYAHGFLRVAVCVPEIRVADPAFNGDRALALAGAASRQGAAIAVFPELNLTAYTVEDLVQQDALLDAGRGRRSDGSPRRAANWCRCWWWALRCASTAGSTTAPW